MKTKEFKDLKGKDIQALNKMVREKKAELSKKAMEIKGGREKNLKMALNIRREIAKILTLIKEKEILAKLEEKGESK